MVDFKKAFLSVREVEKKFFTIAGCVGIAGILLMCVFCFSLMRNIAGLDETLRELQAQCALYQDGGRNYPSEERNTYLVRQDKGLQSILSQLREFPLFWEKMIKKDVAAIAPLQFKESLFRIKKALAKKAKKYKVELCDDVGFRVWEKKIPKSTHLEDLFQSLEVVEHVAEAAITAQVEAIEEIAVPRIAVIQNGVNVEGAAYYEREVTLRLKGSAESIMFFLRKIHASRLLLRIKKMKVSNPFLINAPPVRERSQLQRKKEAPQQEDGYLFAECTIVHTVL